MEKIEKQLNMFSISNVNLIKDEVDIYDLKIKKIQDGVVAFTGHRPNHLPWGTNLKCELFLNFQKKFIILLEKLIKKGYKTFITGMAVGFDLIAAQAILSLKDKYSGLKLVCAMPYDNDYFDNISYGYKSLYEEILPKADEVVWVSKTYDAGCFQRRNEYMVDRCDLCLACFDFKSGGTKNTVDYAIKKNKEVIIIKP